MKEPETVRTPRECQKNGEIPLRPPTITKMLEVDFLLFWLLTGSISTGEAARSVSGIVSGTADSPKPCTEPADLRNVSDSDGLCFEFAWGPMADPHEVCTRFSIWFLNQKLRT